MYGFGPDVRSSQINIILRLQLKTFHEDAEVIPTHPGLRTSGGWPGAHARKLKQVKGSLLDVKNVPFSVSFKPTKAALSSVVEFVEILRSFDSSVFLTSDAMCAKFPPADAQTLYATE